MHVNAVISGAVTARPSVAALLFLLTHTITHLKRLTVWHASKGRSGPSVRGEEAWTQHHTSMPRPRMRETMSSTRCHCPWPTWEGPLQAAPMQKRVLPLSLARSAA